MELQGRQQQVLNLLLYEALSLQVLNLLLYETLSLQGRQQQVLNLLLYEALRYQCRRPYATSVGGLNAGISY